MTLTSSGTYAKLIPDDATADRIMEIVDLINIPNAVSALDLHVTVLYSRVVCDQLTNNHAPLPITADGVSFELFDCGVNNSCLVLKLTSTAMSDLHDMLRDEHDATHDFPTYQPHITLSYDYPYPELPNHTLLAYFKHLVFNKFEVEPLDFMWSDKVE